MDQLEYETRRAELRTTLAQYDTIEMYRMMSRLGGRHTESGPLRAMPYDATKWYHGLTEVMGEAKPIPKKDLIRYGYDAHPNFGVIPESWRARPDVLWLIATATQDLGANVTIVTNHSNVIDVGLVAGDLGVEICATIPGYDNVTMSGDEFSRRSTLIISCGIKTTQLAFPDLVSPTVETLQFFSNVLFSFPTTRSVRTLQFPKKFIEASNQLTKLELEWFRQPGGKILAIAPSASKDIFWGDGIALQHLTNGTMQMMRGIVVPVAVTIDNDQPACTVLNPTFVKSDKDCHAVMHRIARQCLVQTGIPHEYTEQPSHTERILELAESFASRRSRD